MTTLTQTAPAPLACPGILTRLRAWFAERERRRIDRDAFRNLLRLDDAMLRDIGVTRDEVVRAASLPLSHNAALELQALKRGRRSW